MSKQQADWRQYLKSLTPAERDRMLRRVLAWQVSLGADGDIGFHSGQGEPHFYWDATGESLLAEHDDYDTEEDTDSVDEPDVPDERPIRTAGGLRRALSCSEDDEPIALLIANEREVQIGAVSSSGGGTITLLHLDPKYPNNQPPPVPEPVRELLARLKPGDLFRINGNATRFIRLDDMYVEYCVADSEHASRRHLDDLLFYNRVTAYR